jgi:hypothetical protein
MSSMETQVICAYSDYILFNPIGFSQFTRLMATFVGKVVRTLRVSLSAEAVIDQLLDTFPPLNRPDSDKVMLELLQKHYFEDIIATSVLGTELTIEEVQKRPTLYNARLARAELLLVDLNAECVRRLGLESTSQAPEQFPPAYQDTVLLSK